jgi:pimeloyl-ACP methyl ester carboxylesterase
MSGGSSCASILLVSGAAEDDELWADVLEQLPGATTLTLPNTSDLETLGEAVLIALREAIGNSSRGVLVGHSLGGATCLIAASRAPALVDGLVVVASGASMPVHPSLWQMLKDDGESSVISRLASVSAIGPAPPDPSAQDIRQRMLEMMQRADPGTLTNHLRACDAYDAPTVSVPATVVAGARDRLVSPDLAEQLAQRIGAGYELVPDAGHQIPWEAPETVVSAIRNLREPK